LAEFADEGFQGGGWNLTQGAAEKPLFQGGQSSGEGRDFVGGWAQIFQEQTE
jgi:hypothetical protein